MHIDAAGAARSRAAWAAALAAATLLFAGCESSRPDPTRPAPNAAPATSAFDEEELALYRRAVRRVDRFETLNQPILAAGRATREAKRFYQDRLRDWRAGYAELRRLERHGIRIARRPVVISTAPLSIQSFQDNAADVVLARCIDQSDVGMTRDGVPLPSSHDEPVVQEVTVYRYENRTWRIGSFETTDRPCPR